MTIENLDLSNIVLIDRYINDELSEMELREFRNRLIIDHSFKRDFEMVKEAYNKRPSLNGRRSSKKAERIRDRLLSFDFDQLKVSTKGEIAKTIISDGILIIAAAALMLVTCILFMVYLLK